MELGLRGTLCTLYKSRSQQFVLSKVHSLDDVPAIVKDTPDVFCIYSTCEMGVTVVPTLSTRCANFLEKTKKTHYY